MMSKVNSLEVGKPPVITYNVRKLELTPAIKTLYEELDKQYSTIKSTLAKIPIN